VGEEETREEEKKEEECKNLSSITFRPHKGELRSGEEGNSSTLLRLIGDRRGWGEEGRGEGGEKDKYTFSAVLWE